MNVYAAIDLMSGKVVRLREGKAEHLKLYSENPLTVIRRFYEEGFERFHIVDLDAALGLGDNFNLISELLKEKGYKQVAGGIRDVQKINKYLDSGANRVVLSTLAFVNPQQLLPIKDRLTISLDVKNEIVSYEGWKKDSGLKLTEALTNFSEMGFEEFIVTSINRDGTMKGFDRNIAQSVPFEFRKKVLLSGGVLLNEIKEIEMLGYKGCIIGKDLYEKYFGDA
ncbi:MAG: HisA/HisF-related TIM barrel protein [Nitrososphaeria archaeon]|jgi:phosphoribosylformimino-5-aminoimidazole carboxamide ribotide isomerase